MIDIETETLVPLGDVPNIVPRGPHGKPIHVSVAYRWSQKGLHGVRLETVQYGGRRMTSREAISRFVKRLSEKAGLAGGSDAPPVRTPAARRRGHEKANAACESAGW